MALFNYKARGVHGDAIVGNMEAGSTDAVASQLIESGIVPVEIELVNNTSKELSPIKEFFAIRIRSGDLIQFSRQMHSLLKAGVPILSALSGLALSTKNLSLKSAIEKIVISLESGRDLATALDEHPKIFSLFYISMIRIGETSGTLDAIFLQLARYLARDKKTNDQIKAAMRYPSFVLLAIISAVVIINIFVIPAFTSMFAKYNAELPWMTRLIIAVSNFSVQYWMELLLIAIGGIVWLRYYVNTEKGRFNWDKYKLRLPIVGELIYHATLARFSRLFAMSTSAGVPLITALSVVAKALKNTFVESRVLNMLSGIERGDSISRTAAATGMFDSLVMQMMSVGEETGAMDELLQEVADYYDMEVDYSIDRLSAAIEPVLTLCIGVIVLILALGIFLPMWGIADIALHK